MELDQADQAIIDRYARQYSETFIQNYLRALLILLEQGRTDEVIKLLREST